MAQLSKGIATHARLSPEGYSKEKADLDRLFCGQFAIVNFWPQADLLLLKIGFCAADPDRLIPMNTPLISYGQESVRVNENKFRTFRLKTEVTQKDQHLYGRPNVCKSVGVSHPSTDWGQYRLTLVLVA